MTGRPSLYFPVASLLVQIMVSASSPTSLFYLSLSSSLVFSFSFLLFLCPFYCLLLLFHSQGIELMTRPQSKKVLCAKKEHQEKQEKEENSRHVSLAFNMNILVCVCSLYILVYALKPSWNGQRSEIKFDCGCQSQLHSESQSHSQSQSFLVLVLVLLFWQLLRKLYAHAACLCSQIWRFIM